MVQEEVTYHEVSGAPTIAYVSPSLAQPVGEVRFNHITLLWEARPYVPERGTCVTAQVFSHQSLAYNHLAQTVLSGR